MSAVEYLHGFLLTSLFLLGWFHTSFSGKVWLILTRGKDDTVTVPAQFGFKLAGLGHDKSYGWITATLADLLMCPICLGVWVSVMVGLFIFGATLEGISWSVTWVPMYHLVFHNKP